MKRSLAQILPTLTLLLAWSPALTQTAPVRGSPSANIARLIGEFATAKYFWQQTDIARELSATGDRSVIVAIQPYLETNDRRRRCNAAFVLAGLGDGRGTVIRKGCRTGFDRSDARYLLRALKDEHANVRVSTVRSLAEIGDPAALPALRAALGDGEATEVNAPTTVAAEAEKAIATIESKR